MCFTASIAKAFYEYEFQYTNNLVHHKNVESGCQTLHVLVCISQFLHLLFNFGCHMQSALGSFVII